MKLKRFLIIAVLIIFSANIKAQQLPLYSQYMMNEFLLNPGIAGSLEYIPICLTARQQWVGIENAPSTQVLSAHGLLPDYNIGVGGYIFNDRFGPISSTGGQISAAYHMKINNDVKLGLGLSLSAYQFKLDETNNHAIDQFDEVLTGVVETTFVPDANFGAYLYSSKFFAGFSAAQLLQYKLKLHDIYVDNNQMIRHYYLTGGYKFMVNDEFDVMPSLLLKGTGKSPTQLDVNVKAFYKKNYWLGFSYRTSRSLVSVVGIKYNRYFVGYAYDYDFSSLRNHSSGSHEIMLGINLGNLNTTPSLL